MLFPGQRTLPSRFQLLLASLQLSNNLPFSDVLRQEQIEEVCHRHQASHDDEDKVVFTPALTLWGFLSQVIHKQEQRSCLAAVARIGVLLVATGRARCVQNSGPYCRARGRLPLEAVQELTMLVADNAQEKALPEWLWYGRHVKLVDGTTVTMPDTAENQEAYPQQSLQKEGLGFPIARLVAVLSLATGMLCQLAIAPYRGKGTGETALLRKLMETFQAHEIALLDKLFANYWTLADFVLGKVDVVSVLNETRQIDWSKAIRLGKHEYLIRLTRPTRPTWMDETTYSQIPASLELRAIQTQVTQRGFRPTSFWIVTSLTDPNTYSGGRASGN